ncbi:hypothetical protein [Arthrobacter sp. NPDC090010]|uniref:hypothetical protein n=1 Tax=Arthrobacter sp. NPDC090010 TaxID=3363942 RepID=UPI0038213B51
MDSLLQAPRRRAVAEMKRELGAIEVGDTLRVLFANERHGVFMVSGLVHMTGLGDFVIGGQMLAGPKVETTDKSGELVARNPDNDVKKLHSDSDVVPDGSVFDAVAVSHGDLVSVEFEQEPYGLFSVFGVATRSRTGDQVVVGAWIIAHDGVVNHRLVSCRLVAKAGGHPVPIPQERAPFDSDVVND